MYTAGQYHYTSLPRICPTVWQGSNSVTVKLSYMSENVNDAEVPEASKKLADGLRSSRESLKSVGEKTRLLQEQLIRLEKKLWGKKADETVQS